ncbi:MAG: AAA family ATPase [Deltaproteobacteria bacterium]|nr:AAA family ATPase [Deltaproteobacteria bacterium]
MVGKGAAVTRFTTEEARVRVVAWMRAQRPAKSQADVARAIGISGGAFNSWLKNKYPGDNEAITAKVCSLLAVETEREAGPRGQEFVHTKLAREILEACRFAHVHREIAVVYGAAGMGKTVAVKHYKAEHRDAIYVRCDPSFRSPMAVLAGANTALGRRAKWAGHLRVHIHELVELLEGSGRLLIFDEAQFLSLRSLEVLRTLHDSAEVGLVLCGNEWVYQQMLGNGRAAFAQLFSRVGIRRPVALGVSDEDVAALAQGFAGDLSADCLAYLGAKAGEHGGVRRLVKVLQLGVELASAEDETPKLLHLQMAEAMLMGGAAA